MPFIDINGTNLFYETFGEDHPRRAPIVLIHGSTNTGRSDWSLVAPLLGREYRVIVPDCRGHGLSPNPNMTYSFREMADDTAALVRALGYPRAHIIGHSNGGNVALVTLVEHPEIVQTAIPQAANAWVSPDLIEKEPRLFDPDRVRRERPEWMNEMIALHSSVHGTDYWRILLQLTVKEIISQPNYTPGDLGKVRRPTLVIQGQNDSVNAPYQHAQFIAQHIPEAELWIPPGIGHNVHLDILFEWVERVLDFLKRRGDDDNDALYRLGWQRFRDKRVSIFDVRAERMPDPIASENAVRGGKVTLLGQVSLVEQRQAIQELFTGRGIDNQVTVLLDGNTPWALIKRSLANIRKEPRNLSELVSQGLPGEMVRILDNQEGWSKVRLENDGYMGWVQEDALYRCTGEDARAYQAQCNAVVMAERLEGSLSVDKVEGGEAGKLPFGVSVRVVKRQAGMAALELPDGTIWWVAETGLLNLDERPSPDSAGIDATLRLFRRFIGIPYLWGGRSTFGFDCSGLVQTFLGFMGVLAPRDADQQYKASHPVEGNPLPGDLLFFGGETGEKLAEVNVTPPERLITHVAISLGGSDILHATAYKWSVTYESIDPHSPLYRPWLHQHLVKVGRLP